jgi:hypothetical protein
VVFLTARHAVPALTTVLLPLDMVKTTSSLETHGVPHGVRMDISESLPSKVQVSVVSKWNQLFQSSEQVYIPNYLKLKIFNDIHNLSNKLPT